MEILKKQNGISLIVVAIIVIAVIILLVILGNGDYELTDSEEVAYTSLRYSIAKSARDGNDSFDENYFDLLKNMVNNADSSNEWFSETNGTFYGKTEDTSDYEITYITDGSFFAKFTVKNTGTTRYLVEYKFGAGQVSGYAFEVQ